MSGFRSGLVVGRVHCSAIDKSSAKMTWWVATSSKKAEKNDQIVFVELLFLNIWAVLLGSDNLITKLYEFV